MRVQMMSDAGMNCVRAEVLLFVFWGCIYFGHHVMPMEMTDHGLLFWGCMCIWLKLERLYD